MNMINAVIIDKLLLINKVNDNVIIKVTWPVVNEIVLFQLSQNGIYSKHIYHGSCWVDYEHYLVICVYMHNCVCQYFASKLI